MNHLRDQELVSGAELKASHSLLYSQNALWRLQGGEKARSWEGKGSLSAVFVGPATSLPRLTALWVSPPGGQGQVGDAAVRGGYVLGVQNL